jgi:membrane associated rhomboid family serine protease
LALSQWEVIEYPYRGTIRGKQIEMIFPIGTDEPVRREAICTYALMVVTVLCFFLGQEYKAIPLNPELGIDPADVEMVAQLTVYQWQCPTWMPLKNPGFEWYQLFTYPFAQMGIWHLAVSMAFLFALGRALENKLGHMAFLALYLVGGALAGVVHILTSTAPAIGASGPVCVLIGAFLALMPNSNVRLAYFWFVSVGVLEVTGLTVVLAYFCLDLFMTRWDPGAFSSAYTVHITGYLLGVAVGLLLLKIKYVPRGHNDLLYMISQYRRRQEFRRQIQSGSQPWMSAPTGTVTMPGAGAPLPAEKEQVMQLRAQVSKLTLAGDLDGACKAHGELVQIDPTQTLPRQVQHDVANHYFATGQHAAAAAAYERFLATYPADLDKSQVQLMLTVLYVRYLKEPGKAKAILDEVMPILTDADQKQLAQGLREEMDGLGAAGQGV